jgi:hypothetical protein
MTPKTHREKPYSAGDERPPWIEEAIDPTYWDLAFGSYGDGYFEWVNTHYFWDANDPRTVADSRTLWNKRSRYALPPDAPLPTISVPWTTRGSAGLRQ